MNPVRNFALINRRSDVSNGINSEACSSNWLERRTPNPDVGGSSPSRPAKNRYVHGGGLLAILSSPTSGRVWGT